MFLHEHMRLAIIMPENPGKVETFAGEELRKYIIKIFGDEVSFLEEKDNADAVFIIGGPRRNLMACEFVSEAEFENNVPGPEGFIYHIIGNGALIAGSDEVGTLYGVYELLERELGCCFGAFSNAGVRAGEVVPNYAEKTIEDTCRCKASADLPYRTAIVQFDVWAGNADRKLTLPFIDYLAKNRYNRILTWMSVYYELEELGLVAELQKRGIRLTVGHHQALETFLPFEGNKNFPTAYGKEHPEFFRVLPDGTRQTSIQKGDYYGQWLLCSRNEECIEEMAKNINEWLEENPVVDTIALWPNDGISEQCCCEKCEPYSKQDNYLFFLNEVAKRLHSAHEERKVDVLIYRDLWECPQNADLCRNIVIDISTWTPQGLRYCGKADGSALIGSHICKNMHAFHDAGSQVVLYEYYMGNYGNKQAVMPSADEMQSIFRYCKQNGFEGSGTQIECFNVWNNILNFYCFARTAYDTELSLEEGVSALCRLFGNGANDISEVMKIYERTLDGQVPINETGKWIAENIDAERVYGLFNAAMEKAENPHFRNNIRLLRMAFRYTMLLQADDDTAKAELGVMASFFDSFNINDPGYGIAIATDARTDTLPQDIWYQIED